MPRFPFSSPLTISFRLSHTIVPSRPRRTMSHVYPTNPQSPTDLLTALPTKFEEARQSGQLFFFPSQAKDIYSKGKRVSRAMSFDYSPMSFVSPLS